MRITGDLSSNDVVQITTLVRQYNIRWSTNSHPVKSIAVLSNGTVEVWFTAKELHWGEGGNILEKKTNGWQIIGELFR